MKSNLSFYPFDQPLLTCILLTLSHNHLWNWSCYILCMNNLWEEDHSPANLWNCNLDWSSCERQHI